MIAMLLIGICIGVIVGGYFMQRLIPRPAPAPEHHVPSAIGVGPQTIGVGSIDAGRLKLIFKAIEDRTMLEIKRP
jgi:hypothetical protein